MDVRFVGRLAVLCLLLAATVVLVVFIGGQQPHGPSSSRRPMTTPGVLVAPQPPTAVGAYVDFSFPAGDDSSTARVGSRLWYAQGTWWAVLKSPQGPFRIFQLEMATQSWTDTGVFVDERANIALDVVADSDRVAIVTAGPTRRAADAVRVTELRYDQRQRRYVAMRGSPIDIAAGGAQLVDIDRDGAGRLWLAFVSDQRLIVLASGTSGLMWSLPLSVGSTSTQVIHAALVAAAGRVAVVWADAGGDRLDLAMHHDAAPDDEWETSSLEVPLLTRDPNQLALAATDDGRLFVAAKTGLGSLPHSDPGWTQILLLERDPTDAWHSHQVSEVRDEQEDPIIAIDSDTHSLYVFTIAPTGGVYSRVAPLDDLRFTVSAGRLIVPATPGGRLDGLASTSQVVGAKSGVVVLAIDRVDQRYTHALLTLSHSPAPRDRPARAVAAPNPRVAAQLVDESFDEWTAGAPLPTGWTVRGPGIVGIRSTDATHARSAVVASSSADSTRVCRQIPAVNDGTLTLSLDFLASSFGAGDDTVTSLWSGGAQVVSVRLNRLGRFGYFVGPDKLLTDARATPGQWFHSIIVLQPAVGTYAWRVTTSAGVSLFDLHALHSQRGAIDRFCTEASAGDRRVAIDNLRVTQE